MIKGVALALLRQPGRQLAQALENRLQALRVGDQQDDDDEQGETDLRHGFSISPAATRVASPSAGDL